MKITRHVLLPLVLVGALASAALAGDVLKLKNGDLIPGRAVAVNGEAVTFEPESGGSMTVPWAKVHPISRYELWKATLASDDTSGRLELARWALSADLFRYARREVDEARGLGYEDTDGLDAMMAGIHEAEADKALADVDALITGEKYKDALQRITRYIRDSEDETQQKRVRKRVPDIVLRIERQEELARAAEKDDRKKAKQTAREKWVAKTLVAAQKKKAGATSYAIEGFTYLTKGNQTRSRRNLGKAESGYQAARQLYKRVRKVVGTSETAELCKREMADCDRRTVGVLQRWGALEVDNKSWRKASAIVDRGLKIDPVDRELLDLRKTIDENWIRRRLSGISNAVPR